jgi:hypothetical protein
MSNIDPAYPYAGNPRRFVSVAMPNGDAMFGIEGQLVFLTEQRGQCQDRPKFLTRAEAEQLRDALDAAIRSFGMAAAMSEHFAERDADPDRPRAYTGPYPIHGMTLAEVG